MPKTYERWDFLFHPRSVLIPGYSQGTVHGSRFRNNWKSILSPDLFPSSKLNTRRQTLLFKSFWRNKSRRMHGNNHNSSNNFILPLTCRKFQYIIPTWHRNTVNLKLIFINILIHAFLFFDWCIGLCVKIKFNFWCWAKKKKKIEQKTKLRATKCQLPSIVNIN